jgi:hypothetical protein
MVSHLQDAPAQGSRESIEQERARKERKWAAGVAAGATANDVKRLLGGKVGVHLEDVLALHPALADLERAAAWLDGDKAGQPLKGKAAAIFHTVQAKDGGALKH